MQLSWCSVTVYMTIFSPTTSSRIFWHQLYRSPGHYVAHSDCITDGISWCASFSSISTQCVENGAHVDWYDTTSSVAVRCWCDTHGRQWRHQASACGSKSWRSRLRWTNHEAAWNTAIHVISNNRWHFSLLNYEDCSLSAKLTINVIR